MSDEPPLPRTSMGDRLTKKKHGKPGRSHEVPSVCPLRSASCARFSWMRTAARWSHWYAQYPMNPNAPAAMAWPAGSVATQFQTKQQSEPSK